jgi:hypothetical protein
VVFGAFFGVLAVFMPRLLDLYTQWDLLLSSITSFLIDLYELCQGYYFLILPVIFVFIVICSALIAFLLKSFEKGTAIIINLFIGIFILLALGTLLLLGMFLPMFSMTSNGGDPARSEFEGKVLERFEYN